MAALASGILARAPITCSISKEDQLICALKKGQLKRSLLNLIQAMPRVKGKLPLHRWFLQVAVQEEGKQAPVKLNKEASEKVTKLRD